MEQPHSTLLIALLLNTCLKSFIKGQSTIDGISIVDHNFELSHGENPKTKLVLVFADERQIHVVIKSVSTLLKETLSVFPGWGKEIIQPFLAHIGTRIYPAPLSSKALFTFEYAKQLFSFKITIRNKNGVSLVTPPGSHSDGLQVVIRQLIIIKPFLQML